MNDINVSFSSRESGRFIDPVEGIASGIYKLAEAMERIAAVLERLPNLRPNDEEHENL
jgi:hypothetical protein